MMYNTRIEEDYIVRNLLDSDRNVKNRLGGDITYRQLSFFDDSQEEMFPKTVVRDNSYGVLTGQL